MNFQENLKYYRKKAGYKTAKDFANVLNISYTTYFAYENTEREPKYDLLIKISNLLNVSIDDLIKNEKQTISNDDILKNKLSSLLTLKNKNFNISLVEIYKDKIKFSITILKEQKTYISFIDKKTIIQSLDKLYKHNQKIFQYYLSDVLLNYLAETKEKKAQLLLQSLDNNPISNKEDNIFMKELITSHLNDIRKIKSSKKDITDYFDE